MIIGEVVGSVWATRKEESLTGLKLLIIKTLDEQQRTIVAADQIGAGMGDKVLVSTAAALLVRFSAIRIIQLTLPSSASLTKWKL